MVLQGTQLSSGPAGYRPQSKETGLASRMVFHGQQASILGAPNRTRRRGGKRRQRRRKGR